ncbi:MAG: hypothetical protein AM325_003480 [Candidatus Thorarchaeota archaeon SMTZ1-45]|nr:MAG: hypothetical protein AM325_05255 [Candidatus Thorarchaeota archaeon SMTZ1-45]
MDEDKSKSEDMAAELIDAIDDEMDDDDVRDGLTKKERELEISRESDRKRKAQELKKQLRRRQLGFLTYRWPAFVLIFGGILAISTEFLQVMVREPGVPPDVGFDTFVDALFLSGGVFYIFPVIAGGFMIVLSYFVYTNPRYTWLAIIPAMMLVMSGAYVYYLVDFAVAFQPELMGLIYATLTPISMIIAGVIALLAIVLREKED